MLVSLVIRTGPRKTAPSAPRLDGYEAFTRQTRYRLFPGVW